MKDFKLSQTIWILCAISATCLAGTYSGGTGTEIDPYQISTPADWLELIDTPSDGSAHFVLTNGIDLQGETLLPVPAITGSFDGNNHVISNATINLPDETAVGLFSYVYDGGEIRNLGVENVDIVGELGVGGLVGSSSYGSLITNCFVTGWISGHEYVGGISGWSETSDIKDCWTDATVIASQNFAGGLVAMSRDRSVIQNCLALGIVVGKNYIGGLVGSNSWNGSGGSSGLSVINDCYVEATVIGDDYLGGLVGDNSGPINRCYATGQVNGSGIYVGGLVGCDYYNLIKACFWNTESTGQINGTIGRGLTSEQMKNISFFQNADWNQGPWVMADRLDTPRLAWEQTGDPPVPPAEVSLQGAGTETDPYQIWTAEEFALLSWLTSITDKHIALMTDIDLDGVELWPIGDLCVFSGVFNGNNHTLLNAVLYMPDRDNVGLFSQVGPDTFTITYPDPVSSIKNLNLHAIHITGRSYVGGLAASSGGIIKRCNITHGIIEGENSVGGLIGESIGFGIISDTESYFSIIQNCSVSASVSGSIKVGGLAGNNSSRVENCYVQGIVSGSDYVGGLVGGGIWGYITWPGGTVGTETCGDINSCYVAAQITATGDYVGGLTGVAFTSNVLGWHWLSKWDYLWGDTWEFEPIAPSFWDTEVSDLTNGAGMGPADPNMIGLTTNEMQNITNFINVGWDFAGQPENGTEDIWWMPPSDYPRLTSQGCPYSVPADLNNDCKVDIADLSKFAQWWLVNCFATPQVCRQ